MALDLSLQVEEELVYRKTLRRKYSMNMKLSRKETEQKLELS
jgi:hypothetical protein